MIKSNRNNLLLTVMSKEVSTLQAAGYEPYDQIYGYGMHEYFTRVGGVREIVTKMDVKDIKVILKYYKEHK